MACDLVEFGYAFYARKVFEVFPRKEYPCSLDIWPSITPGPRYFFVQKSKKKVLVYSTKNGLGVGAI